MGRKSEDFALVSRTLLVTVVDWLIGRLITLNALKASDEITEDQSRQVRAVPTCPPCSRWLIDVQMLFDIENAYNEFFRSLSGKS